VVWGAVTHPARTASQAAVSAGTEASATAPASATAASPAVPFTTMPHPVAPTASSNPTIRSHALMPRRCLAPTVKTIEEIETSLHGRDIQSGCYAAGTTALHARGVSAAFCRAPPVTARET
jgi:hypothetical protein